MYKVTRDVVKIWNCCKILLKMFKKEANTDYIVYMYINLFYVLDDL